MSVAEKSFDPLDRTVTLVDAKDDLDPFSFEDGVLKAQLPCGHVVSAESLTDSCRAQLDEGNYKFKCTAFVDGRLCNQPLPYREVRRLADLTVEEMLYFEENIARLAAADHTDVQTCPKCRTNIERMDMSNLCVECSVCSADQEESYLFCWQCLKPWTGPAPRSDRCANSDCRNYELQLLQTCSLTDLPQVRGVDAVPSIRACPTCTEEEEEENNKTEATSAFFNSAFRNHTDEVIIKGPETEETSERYKQQVKGINNKGERRHGSQHLDLGLGESRQNDVQIHPANNLTPKNTTNGQTLNQVRAEIVPDTNDQKTKKNKRFWMKWFRVIPLKKHS